MVQNNILIEGKNCWKLAKANKFAYLIDGSECFRAIHEALTLAKESIFIVNWDIHSELLLVRDDNYNKKYPAKLGELLAAIGEERPELNIYILEWNFAMIYAMERELFPDFKMYWKTNDRVNFCLDGEHPVGAAQHQKIVVIDDSLAFSGGLDLTQCRWDTPEHDPDNKLRVSPDNTPFPPFHDVHCVFNGKAASLMGQLARDRWVKASNSSLPDMSAEPEFNHWPSCIEPALENVEIGISRTLPEYGEQHEVREVEQLYLDSINAAQELIYIENQFLSSHKITKELERKLAKDSGPEIIIVLPELISGWLMHNTMDVLRARMLQRLFKADAHGRLHCFYVRLRSKPKLSLMIHSKVMIIDERFLRIASSNLCNRSMGLDSECDISLEATQTQPCHKQIEYFRNCLLAEHLGVSVEKLEKMINEKSSLIKAIEALQGNEHTLAKLEVKCSGELEYYVPESELLDPEKPVEPEEFFKQVFYTDKEPKAYHYWIKSGMFFTVLIGLIAIFQLALSDDWLSLETFASSGKQLSNLPMMPLIVVAVYMVASALAIPITLLIVVTIMLFGAWTGSVYALIGAELSALATFAIGRMIGKKRVYKLIGTQYNRIWNSLGEKGFLTIITLRIIPVAPFSIINIGASVSAIKVKDFAVGNLIGILPGIVMNAFIVKSLMVNYNEPNILTFSFLVVAILLIVSGLFWLKRWFNTSKFFKQESVSK